MRRIPRWGKVLIGVAGLLLALALALPYLLDVERYRPEIIAAIENATGRKATIGQLRARLIPTIGFTVDDVRLSSPATFGDRPLFTIETVRGSLAWAPLLHKQLKVSGVQLIRPKVQMLSDADGRTNFDFSDPAPAASSSSNFALADIDSIEIRDADLTFGQVTRDQTLRPSLHLSHITIRLTDIALASPLARWRGAMTVTGLRADIPGFLPMYFGSGDVTLADRAVAAQFALPLGKAADVTGAVHIDDLTQPVVRFELRTSMLDLGEMGSLGVPPTAPPATSVTAPASKPAATRAPRTPAPPNPAPTGHLIAEGHIFAQRVRLAPIDASVAQIDIRIFSDRIEVSPLSVQLYDGTIDITGLLNTAATPATLNAAINVHGVSIGKLASAIAPASKMTGIAELTLQVIGALGDDVLASLEATGKAAVRRGVIPGFEMNGVMAQVARIGSLGRLGTYQDNELAIEIPYDSITADLSVASKRVLSKRIHMDSSAGTMDLSGSASFDQTIAYDGRADFLGGPKANAPKPQPKKGFLGAVKNLFGAAAKQAAKQTIGRVNVPFKIRGAFGSPQVTTGIGITGLTRSGKR